jgi:hypothetical protein
MEAMENAPGHRINIAPGGIRFWNACGRDE